ncbi:MAG TPA: hypothetical protein DCS23_00925 [Candidatus Yonathbacteria bacterium]|nr:hypothetical protein [Candidatus Yonathbacteria bacterium]
MKKYLVFVIVLLLPMHVHAEAIWTGSIGVGQMAVLNTFRQSDTEKQISNATGIINNSDIKNKTTYKSLALGRCWNEIFCIEAAYLWGARFSKSLSINNTGIGVINVNGSAVNFNALPANIFVRQDADVTASQLSALLKLPASDYVDIFGRVGFYEYNVKTTTRILLPDTSTFLADESKYRGTTPMISVGVDAKFPNKISLRFEGQRTGAFSIFSAILVYEFK